MLAVVLMLRLVCVECLANSNFDVVALDSNVGCDCEFNVCFAFGLGADVDVGVHFAFGFGVNINSALNVNSI